MDFVNILILFEHPPPPRKLVHGCLSAVLGGGLAVFTGHQLGMPAMEAFGFEAGAVVFGVGYVAGLIAGYRLATGILAFVWPEDR